MALYYPGCTETVNDPACTDCPDKELGDIRSIFLVKKTFSFTDIQNPAEWSTGIAARNIYVFPYTRGSLAVAENEQPGFGDTLTTIESYEYTLNVMEPNYKGNWAFWDSIRTSNNWKIGWRTQTQVHISDVTAVINPKAPVAEDKKQAIFWNIVFKFIQQGLPRPSDMPTSIFDRCIAVS